MLLGHVCRTIERHRHGQVWQKSPKNTACLDFRKDQSTKKLFEIKVVRYEILSGLVIMGNRQIYLAAGCP